MSNAKDDVKADLASTYDGLERTDVERIVGILAASPAGHAASSVGVALRPLLPSTAERLASSSSDDATDYLRVLTGSATFVLQSWEGPQSARPSFEDVRGFIDRVEE